MSTNFSLSMHYSCLFRNSYKYSALTAFLDMIHFEPFFKAPVAFPRKLGVCIRDVNKTIDISNRNKVKGKSVPLQTWSSPEGFRKLKFPDFMTTAQKGGKVVSLTHRPHLPPRKFSWYSFLLEAESIPGP